MYYLYSIYGSLIDGVLGFLVISLLLFSFFFLKKWLVKRNLEENGKTIDTIERLALQAVMFAESMGVTNKLFDMGLSKKDLAIRELEQGLKKAKIKADLTELDKQIEIAWYKEFGRKE